LNHVLYILGAPRGNPLCRRYQTSDLDFLHRDSRRPLAALTEYSAVYAMDSKEISHDAHHEDVEAISPDLAGKDKAAQLLKQVDHPIHVTQSDNARVLRKIDLTILPILLTVYCLQYLDKATLAYASVFGLLKDANLHGEDYSWLGSIVYVAQLIFQPLIAFLLVKLPIGKFAATMVLGWGTVLCCMVAATTFKGLMAARFFLGAFEASVGESSCSPALLYERHC
jgi:hypothetical protein